MLLRSTPKSAIWLSTLALAILLSGCVTTQQTKEVVLTPEPDNNAIEIISHVKDDPSMITGGGMIYELFVGQRFAARYNEKSQLLRITDIESENACEFGNDGVLKLPENATEEYLNACSRLSTNTIDYLNQ